VDPSGHAYSQLTVRQAGEAAKIAKKTKSISTQHSAADAQSLSPSSGFIEEDVRSVLSELRRRETDGYDCIPEYFT
jgi:hypothetical protein